MEAREGPGRPGSGGAAGVSRPGPVRTRPAGAALLALSVLGLLGCRSVVKADPAEWTVDRALSVIRDVESTRVRSCRRQAWHSLFLCEHGLFIASDPEGLPEGDPEDCLGIPDPAGFEDFRFSRTEVVRGPSVAAILLGTAFVVATGVSPGPGSLETRRSLYETRYIAFADIDRVVIARKGYPFLGFTVLFGPWWHDVELRMKDRTRVLVYRMGPGWLNVFPVWLYPACWLHATESREFAEAIEYLRARAAGEVDGVAGPAE